MRERAASTVAPLVLARAGRVTALAAEPDGLNITPGRLHPPRRLVAAVLETGADAGVAFDGDATAASR